MNSTDEFFSNNFFIEDLKIPKGFKYIFFEYFDDQKISSKLLNPKKRLILIDKLFEVSNNFLNIIDQAKTLDNKTLKDSTNNNFYVKKDFN